MCNIKMSFWDGKEAKRLLVELKAKFWYSQDVSKNPI